MATRNIGTCPNNEMVECEVTNCAKCGWNPEVSAKRIEACKETLLTSKGQKRYRIPFTGYCEVWATSPEEAVEMAEDIEKQFFAHYEYGEATCY